MHVELRLIACTEQHHDGKPVNAGQIKTWSQGRDKSYAFAYMASTGSLILYRMCFFCSDGLVSISAY